MADLARGVLKDQARAIPEQHQRGFRVSRIPPACVPGRANMMDDLLSIPVPPGASAGLDVAARPPRRFPAFTPERQLRGAQHQRRIARHAAGVLSISHAVTGQVSHPAVPGKAKVDGIVRGRPVIRTESTKLRESGAPEHRRTWRPDEVARQPSAIQIGRLDIVVSDSDGRAVFVHHLTTADDRGGRRLRHERARSPRESGRQENVVRIEEHDELAARGGQSGIAGGRHAAIRLMYYVRAEFSRNLARPIRRSIVDHDAFDRLMRLFPDAPDCIRQVSSLVVAGNDDGDSGKCAGHGQPKRSN